MQGTLIKKNTVFESKAEFLFGIRHNEFSPVLAMNLAVSSLVTVENQHHVKPRLHISGFLNIHPLEITFFFLSASKAISCFKFGQHPSCDLSARCKEERGAGNRVFLLNKSCIFFGQFD